MGFRKGVELTTNTIIIIALGLLVLILTVVWLGRAYLPLGDATVDAALMDGCKQYGLTKTEPEAITIGDINKDGSIDTLLFACQLSAKKMDMGDTECKKICSQRFPGLIPAPEE